MFSPEVGRSAKKDVSPSGCQFWPQVSCASFSAATQLPHSGRCLECSVQCSGGRSKPMIFNQSLRKLNMQMILCGVAPRHRLVLFCQKVRISAITAAGRRDRLRPALNGSRFVKSPF